MLNVTLDDYKAIVESCSDGIVLFDRKGALLFSNAAFQRYPEPMKEALLKRSCTDFSQDYLVKRVRLSNGEALIVQETNAVADHDAVLSTMLQSINNAPNIYAATAEAVHHALGWRWVSVTRFVGDSAQVLAHWDTDALSNNFTFELSGTPCEVMASSKRYTLFTDVAKAFPSNEALQQLGAHSYAGLIYRGADQQPIGHIMAIHDQRDVDYQHAEDVITLASLALSANMLLARANEELKTALEESRTDCLTGLHNRKMFDQQRQQMVTQYDTDETDSCLAIVDLDSFKAYNDFRGHQAGDMLLQLVATELSKLGRETDLAFRIGGDEFAIIFPEAADTLPRRIKKQFHAALKRLSLITGTPIDSSIGFALLSEVYGEGEAWYELADQRMYLNKKRALHIQQTAV